jgi:hypothetical protein
VKALFVMVLGRWDAFFCVTKKLADWFEAHMDIVASRPVRVHLSCAAALCMGNKKPAGAGFYGPDVRLRRYL